MRGTRLFFTICMAVSAIFVIVVTTSALQTRAMSAEVSAGWGIWRANGCEGCHTVYGSGGAYAPDLTHIYSQRGPDYIREFLANPGAFHPGQRPMPAFGLTRGETDSLLAFLEWVEDQPPAQSWPPAPIYVSGGGIALDIPTSGESVPSSDSDDPAVRGAYWFSRPPAICSTCHSLEPNVVIVGPSLAGIASRAGARVPGQSAEAYIRNSIINPGDHVVEGFQNVMAQNLGEVLSGDQLNDIIAFLLTLE